MKTISMCLMMCLATGVVRADWLQFRGPNATAVSTEAKAPGDDLKVAWAADLPGRGLSAPIVVGDRVFVTCSSGPGQETLHVFCFNAADGTKRWERAMRSTGRTMTHNKTCVAAATPCSDGEHVFALYSSNDLFAFDLDFVRRRHDEAPRAHVHDRHDCGGERQKPRVADAAGADRRNRPLAGVCGLVVTGIRAVLAVVVAVIGPTGPGLALVVVAIPVEAWLMARGLRVYGPSATERFTGLTLPVARVPLEVVFAVGCCEELLDLAGTVAVN